MLRIVDGEWLTGVQTSPPATDALCILSTCRRLSIPVEYEWLQDQRRWRSRRRRGSVGSEESCGVCKTYC